MDMHSSDRTLLASLGFADPDKKDRRHTLACQYLAQPEVMGRVYRHVTGARAERYELPEREIGEIAKAPSPPPPQWEQFRRHRECWEGESVAIYSAHGPRVLGHFERAELEVAIRRQGGFLIGFWDLVARGCVSRPLYDVKDTYARLTPKPGLVDGYVLQRAWADEPELFTGRAVSVSWSQGQVTVACEVKATRCDVADIARQVELYKGGSWPGSSCDSTLLVATLFPLPAADKATLSTKGIDHVYLGAPFDAWCRAQADQSAPDPVEF